MKRVHPEKIKGSATELNRVRVHANARRPLLLNAIFCILVGVVLLSFDVLPAFGRGGDIVWQTRDAKVGKQEAKAAAVDPYGNVIVTGYQNTAGGTDNNYYTVKFRSDGTIAWSAAYDMAGGSDISTAVAVSLDSDNDVIVTGNAWNGNHYDIHTIKYNGNTGAVLWQHTYSSGNGNDYATSLGVDSLNNIYVGGFFQSSSGDDDCLIIKYSSQYPEYPGTAVNPEWVETYGNTGLGYEDRLLSISVGTDGVAATGYSWNGSDFDSLTRKYGFDKSLKWEQRSGGTANDRGLFVKMDGEGNVVVAGYRANALNHDIMTVKYNGTSGSVMWEKLFDGGDEDEPAGLWVTPSGDVYVTGFTWNLTGRYDFYTVRYSAAGAKVWEKTFNSYNGNDDIPTGIVVDNAGDIFVTGYTYKALAGDYDFQTLKYKEEDGTQLWSASFDSAAHKDDRPLGIGISSTGDVFVAGWSDAWNLGLSDYDYYVIKYDPGLINAPGNLTATAVTNTQVTLSWTDNSDNEDTFDIWRKLGEAGTYEKIGSVGANVTTYTDAAGLLPDNYYYYKVRAVNAINGNSHFSNEAHVLTRVVNYGAPAWSFVYGHPDNGDDIANAIATGTDNHPVVTGYSYSLTGGFDYSTFKLNRSDGAVLWNERYDDVDSEQDVAVCITVDRENNATVSGFSSLYGGGAMNTNDIYTIKYPASGTPESWHSQYNGPAGGDDRSTAVASAADASKNTAVVGYGKNVLANEDIYVLKYAESPTLDLYGNAIPLWAAVPFDRGGDDYPSAVAFDSAGNVLVTGYSHNGANYDFFTAKYDSGTGARIWTAIFDGAGHGNDQAKSLAVDLSGDVYVTGYAVNAAGNEDFTTIKYNGATGALIWEKTYDGAGHGNDEAVSVRIDPIDGAVIVAGTSLTSAGNNDFHVLRYRADDGTLIWERNFERHDNDDYVSAMEVDSSGYIYIAGTTNNGANLDILSIIYDYEGTFLDAVLFNGAASSDDVANAIAVNYRGEAFIAGYTRNAGGNADYAVLKQINSFILVPAPLLLTPQADFSRINLSWNDNTPGTSFRIERTTAPATPSSVWTLINTAAAGSTSYQDTGLNFNSGYCYRIEAFSGSLSSRKTVACTITTLHAPAWNLVIGSSTTQIDLSWQDVPGNAGYKIERQTGAGPWSDLLTLGAGVTTYSDQALTPGTVYSYRVSTLSSSGCSLPNTAQSAVTKPSAPSLNNPSGVTDTTMNLYWGAVTGAANYTLFFMREGESYTVYAPCGGIAATSCTVTGLVSSGTRYYFQVKATNASGDSSMSNEVYGLTLYPVPGTPVLTNISRAQRPDLNTDNTITWSDVSGETGYEIYYSTCNSASSTNPFYCENFNYWGAWYILAYLGADVTAYTHANVTSGLPVRYKVRAKAGSTSSAADSNELASWAFLRPPTQNAISPASDTALTVSWADFLGETNYDILRKTGTDGVYSTIASNLQNNTTSYADTGLSLQTTYCYKIRAYNTTNISWLAAPPEVFSNEQCLETPPVAPDPAALTIVSSNSVTVNWTKNSDQYTGYVVERSMNTNDNPDTDSNSIYWGGWNPIATISDPNTTVYNNTGLTPGYGYKYRVKAIYGTSSYTAYSLERYVRTIPASPSIYALVPDSATQITSYWTDVTGNTGFRLDWKEKTDTDCTAGTWNTVEQTVSSCPYNYTFYRYVCPYSTSLLNEGRTYCYRITALNASGNSAYSAVSTRMTLLSPPIFNDLSGITSSKIDLTWSRVTGNSGYKVERRTGPNGTWSQIGTTLADVESYSDTSISPGTVYYYRLYAKNAENYYSGPSNEKSGTTPPAPPVVTMTVVSPSQITLSWRVVYGATNYKVYRRTGDGAYSQITDLAVPYQELYCDQIYPHVGCTALSPISTSYSDPGLTENSLNCYQVIAYGPGGDSSPSAEQCMTTSDLAEPVLTGSAVNSMNIQLNWTYNPDICTPQPCRSDIDGIELEFRLPSGVWSNFATVAAPGTSFIDRNGINPLTQYIYRGRVYKGTSRSAYSNEVTISTPAYQAGDDTCH